MRIFNGVPECSYRFTSNLLENVDFTVSSIDYYEQKFIPTTNGTFNFEYSIASLKDDCPQFSAMSYSYKFEEAKAYGLFLQPQRSNEALYWYEDQVEKSNRAAPLVRTLANIEGDHKIVWRKAKSGNVASNESITYRKLIELSATDYEVSLDEIKVHQVRLRYGGVYTLIMGSDSVTITKMIEVTPPNSVNILWLVPQYVVMTLGEVMFSITGLEFSYSQAPLTMKSVLQACWLLTVAFGNVIVVVIAELKFFQSQANEFFLFAGLMFVDMLIFMWMAYRYKPNNPNEEILPSENERSLRTEFSEMQSDSRQIPKYNKQSEKY